MSCDSSGKFDVAAGCTSRRYQQRLRDKGTMILDAGCRLGLSCGSFCCASVCMLNCFLGVFHNIGIRWEQQSLPVYRILTDQQNLCSASGMVGITQQCCRGCWHSRMLPCVCMSMFMCCRHSRHDITWPEGEGL